MTAMTASRLGVLLVLTAFLAVLVMEHVYYLEPCPLCVIQRFFLAIAGVGLLVCGTSRIGPSKKISSAVLAFSACMMGGLVALRHVVIQYLPPEELPSCLPGLSYLVDTFPVLEAVGKIYQGSAECAEVQWRLLGLSIPEQSLALFIGLEALTVWILLRFRHMKASTTQ